MKTVIIKTTLGFTEIQGNENGISKIHVMNEDVEISTKIPKELKEAVLQLQEYFNGKRTEFSFKTNPAGTDFQQKVWQELLNIPFGKTFLFRIIKKIRRFKSNSCSCFCHWKKSTLDCSSMSQSYWKRWLINRLCRWFMAKKMVARTRKSSKTRKFVLDFLKSF